MSMIFQSYAVWSNMTVAQNVAFGLKLRRLECEVVRQRLGRILDVVQLTVICRTLSLRALGRSQGAYGARPRNRRVRYGRPVVG